MQLHFIAETVHTLRGSPCPYIYFENKDVYMQYK